MIEYLIEADRLRKGSAMLTFTQLLREIQDCYREHPRVFHVLATRYWLGKETRLELEGRATYRPVTSRHAMRPELTDEQVKTIIANR